MIIEILTSVFIFTFNTAVVIFLVKTSQHRIQSLQLFLFMSIIKINTAILSVSRIILLLKYGELYCISQIIITIIIAFFVYLSFMINGLIIIDRYIHIKYVNSYRNYFYKKTISFSFNMWFSNIL